MDDPIDVRTHTNAKKIVWVGNNDSVQCNNLGTYSLMVCLMILLRSGVVWSKEVF